MKPFKPKLFVLIVEKTLNIYANQKKIFSCMKLKAFLMQHIYTWKLNITLIQL